MSIAHPGYRPQASLDKLLAAIPKGTLEKIKNAPVIGVGVRGYFLNTIGKKGENDLNAFDDALFWVSKNVFASFNANVDPTRYGWNAGAGKYMARLKPGLYQFARWKHKGSYWAFGQAGNPVTVERLDAAGKVRQTETGSFGINIHKAGVTSTSSEGCLTLPLAQWEAYKSVGYSLVPDGAKFPFVLVENRGHF